MRHLLHDKYIIRIFVNVTKAIIYYETASKDRCSGTHIVL